MSVCVIDCSFPRVYCIFLLLVILFSGLLDVEFTYQYVMFLGYSNSPGNYDPTSLLDCLKRFVFILLETNFLTDSRIFNEEFNFILKHLVDQII